MISNNQSYFVDLMKSFGVIGLISFCILFIGAPFSVFLPDTLEFYSGFILFLIALFCFPFGLAWFVISSLGEVNQ